MVEFRWITKPIDGKGRRGPIFFQDDSSQPERGYQRVLQYRYKYPTLSTLVDAYPPRDWIWSDWQDVNEG